jgi:hypothetical protein
MLKTLLSWLRDPVDGASVAVFRIAFGAILLRDGFRHWPRIQHLFLDSLGNPGGGFQFKYYGWGWVPVLPGNGMYVLFAVIGPAAIGIMPGLFYKTACLVFLVTFSWQFFIDQANYLNHFYLVILYAICLLLVTALTECSLDYRSLADLIDPERDLSAVSRSLKPADWILPLDPALTPGHLLQQDLP